MLEYCDFNRRDSVKRFANCLRKLSLQYNLMVHKVIFYQRLLHVANPLLFIIYFGLYFHDCYFEADCLYYIGLSNPKQVAVNAAYEL